MAVSSTDTFSGPYAANGVTVAFPFTFKAVSPDDVSVFIRDVDDNETYFAKNAYTVALAAEGGTVTMTSPPASGDLYIFSDPSFLQPVAFASGQAFLPGVVNEVNDRDVTRALYLKREVDRSPKTPIGGGQEGKYPVVLPDGTWGFSSGTGSDAALRGDLANPSNTLVATRRASLLSAAAYRNMAAKVADRFDFRDMLGADLAGNNDMQSTLEKALLESASSASPMHFSGVIALGSPVRIPSSAGIRGVSTRPHTNFANGGSRGAGSWFHIAHSGVGFNTLELTPGQWSNGITLAGIGTYRDQPTNVGPGWTPNDHDFDFQIFGSDILFDDVMLLNPTRGIRQFSGAAGRVQLRRVRGQPFLIGCQVDDSYDGFITESLRWWPFWSNDLYTRAYTAANRWGLYLRHVDNPSIHGYFCVFSKHSLRLGSHPNGVTNNANLVAPEFDNYGESGLYIEAGADLSSVTITGGYSWGFEGSTHGFQFNANNCQVHAVAHKFQNVRKRAAIVSGTGNTLQVVDPIVENWNMDNDGSEAFAATPGNRVFLNGKVQRTGGNGAAVINSASLISSDEWLSTTALPVDSTTGSIGGASAVFRYNRKNDVVQFNAEISVTSTGTAGGSLRLQLPIPAAAGETFAAVGGLTNGTGLGLRCNIAGSNMLMTKAADNTYPAVDGATIVITGSYKVAPL